MTYLVDGHNLIPKVPGLNLSQLDDEQELISQLRIYCDVKRCQMEVFFDAGKVGMEHRYNLNRLQVHFVRPPSRADDAILMRLLSAGRAARNFTVVTSDRQVQERSRRSGAHVISSSNFARSLSTTLQSALANHPPNSSVKVDDISYWEDQFSKNGDKSH